MLGAWLVRRLVLSPFIPPLSVLVARDAAHALGRGLPPVIGILLIQPPLERVERRLFHRGEQPRPQRPTLRRQAAPEQRRFSVSCPYCGRSSNWGNHPSCCYWRIDDPLLVRGLTSRAVRVFGTFSSSTVVSTFERPFEPDGPQVFHSWSCCLPPSSISRANEPSSSAAACGGHRRAVGRACTTSPSG
jgi:hypothetical protein